MRDRIVAGSSVMRAIAAAGALLCVALLSGCPGGEARACKKDCPIEVVMVCGAEGKEYDNECEAKCEGVEVQYQGPCKVPKDL